MFSWGRSGTTDSLTQGQCLSGCSHLTTSVVAVRLAPGLAGGGGGLDAADTSTRVMRVLVRMLPTPPRGASSRTHAADAWPRLARVRSCTGEPGFSFPTFCADLT
jgi:hypothetical protein